MQNTPQQLNHKQLLLTITPKQQTILHLLYRYRFLDRSHIQHLLNHKDHKTIIQWLNDLTTKSYLVRTYSKTFPNNTKPAVYSLNTRGIAFLSTQPNIDKLTLRKRYREHQRSAAFISTSLLLATLALKLHNHPTQTITVASDYASLPQASQLNQLVPDAFISKTENETTTYYCLEILSSKPTQIRRRIKQYLAWYASNEWEGETGTAFPTLLLASANLPDLIDTKRFIKTLLSKLDEPDIQILTTTQPELVTHGLTGEIWEAVV
jgi:hypothetical protein